MATLLLEFWDELHMRYLRQGLYVPGRSQYNSGPCLQKVSGVPSTLVMIWVWNVPKGPQVESLVSGYALLGGGGTLKRLSLMGSVPVIGGVSLKWVLGP